MAFSFLNWKLKFFVHHPTSAVEYGHLKNKSSNHPNISFTVRSQTVFPYSAYPLVNSFSQICHHRLYNMNILHIYCTLWFKVALILLLWFNETELQTASAKVWERAPQETLEFQSTELKPINFPLFLLFLILYSKYWRVLASALFTPFIPSFLLFSPLLTQAVYRVDGLKSNCN